MVFALPSPWAYCTLRGIYRGIEFYPIKGSGDTTICSWHHFTQRGHDRYYRNELGLGRMKKLIRAAYTRLWGFRTRARIALTSNIRHRRGYRRSTYDVGARHTQGAEANSAASLTDE